MFKTVSTSRFYFEFWRLHSREALREEIMSPDTRLMFGLSLILVPTIVYGGLTVLGVVTNRLMGSPGPANLTVTQIAFYRAGHAHAGVLTLLAMLLQIAVDYAAIPSVLVWPVRVGALAAAILVFRRILRRG